MSLVGAETEVGGETQAQGGRQGRQEGSLRSGAEIHPGSVQGTMADCRGH